MTIAFWSEEDGCGITSAMAAIASICSDVWNLRTILVQSRNQRGDLCKRLSHTASVPVMRIDCNNKKSVPAMRKSCINDMEPVSDIWDELFWLLKQRRLTKTMLLHCMVPVVTGRLYYLPQGEYQKQRDYQPSVKDGVRRIIRCTEQLADLTMIDCGNGTDSLSADLLAYADAVVIGISQERQNLDAYFQNRHVFPGNVIYLVNAYHPESIYNRKNLNRIYRLHDEELAVIPHNPIFRQVSEKGKIECFIRRHKDCSVFDRQFYFMQELIHTAALVLRAAGFPIPKPGSGIGNGKAGIC